MKKNIIRMISFLAVFLMLSGIFSGCGKKKEKEDVQPPKAEEQTAEEKEPEKEKIKYNDSDERSIAISIDNDNKDAWPHSGLDDAYMIYEMYVEGGFTRLIAFFKGKDTKKIGPIRSVRHYFLDYVYDHDAFFVGYGVSPKASEDIRNLNVKMMNGILGDGDYFWREEKYKYDYHSVYTSMEKIRKNMEKKGISSESDAVFLEYNDENTALKSDTPAEKIYIPYSGSYKVTYEYDKETEKYKRTMNSSYVHKSPDGVLYAPTNIILMEVSNYTMSGDSKQRQDFKTVGSGKGKYISMGKSIDITWQKDSRKGKTVYRDLSGNIIKLNPGLTFVNLVPPSMKVTFE